MTIILLKFFILCGGALVALLGLRSRVWGLALIALLLPAYRIRFHIVGVPFTFLEFCILLLFFIFLITEYKQFPWWQKGSWMSIAVLLCAAFVGIFVTPNLVAGLGLWKAYIFEPLLVFLMMSCVKTKRDVAIIVYGLGVAAVIVSIVALVQYVTGWGIPEPWRLWSDRRAVSVYGYPNAVGLFLAPIITLYFGLLLLGQKFCVRRFCWTVVAFGTLALFAAKVDGAQIAVLAAVVLMLFFSQWRWISIAMAIAGGALIFFSDRVRALIFFQDVSGDVRLALWKGTINFLRAHPFVGAGIGGFPDVYDLYRLPSHVELLLYPHNLLFDFWTAFGLLGAVWIVGMIAWVIVTLVRRLSFNDFFPKILLGVVTTYVVYGLVDVVYFKNDLAVMWWIFMGFIIFVITHRKGEHI